MTRLRGSAHAIALGFAVGVFTACTPFLGLQMLSAGLLAWLMGGSIVASFLGGWIANPLTVPLIWLSSYHIGMAMLGQSGRFESGQFREGFARLWQALWERSPDVLQAAMEVLFPVLKPMSIGCVPLGLLLGGLFYILVRRSLEAYQMRRPHGEPQLEGVRLRPLRLRPSHPTLL
ncbi:MAG: DUF2062 domain-containing protein [Hyphomicrobiaceae bacterium]|nr:DUF2062 domain-containing protein [Hyphomicrobiaceae bacterium]